MRIIILLSLIFAIGCGESNIPTTQSNRCLSNQYDEQGRCVLSDDRGEYLSKSPDDGEGMIISEVMANPAMVSDSNGEWLELYNSTDRTILLDSMVIKRGSGEYKISSGAKTVPGKSYFVIARTEDAKIDHDAVANMTLSNKGGTLILEIGGVVVDQVEYPKGISGISWQRSGSGQWCEGSGAISDQNSDQGSPGVAGSCGDLCKEVVCCDNSSCSDGICSCNEGYQLKDKLCVVKETPCIGLSLNHIQNYGALAPHIYQDTGSNGENIQIQFYGETPVGSYQLDGSINGNYQSCQQCVVIFDGDTTYFQQSGTLLVTDTNGYQSGESEGMISNVKLVEVTIDSDTWGSTAVTGGGCIEIESGSWDTLFNCNDLNCGAIEHSYCDKSGDRAVCVCEEGFVMSGEELCEPAEIAVKAGDVIFTEFMANPAVISDIEGEWLELYNTTNRAINLSDLIIERGVEQYQLKTGPRIVAPKGYFVVARSDQALISFHTTADLVLPNSGATLTLKLNDITLDQQSYPGTTSGVSWQRDPSGNWCKSVFDIDENPGNKGTPGTTMSCSPTDPCDGITCNGWEQCSNGSCILNEGRCYGDDDCSGVDMCDHNSCVPPGDPITPISDIQQGLVGANSVVRTRGVITVKESQSIWIQDGDDPYSGIFIYSVSDYINDLSVGDEIILTGTYLEYNNLSEIKGVTELIKTGKTKKLPESVTLTNTDLSSGANMEQLEGMLVRFTGVLSVTGGDSKTITLVDQNNHTHIIKTSLYNPQLQINDYVTSITGVLSQYKDQYQIMPRFEADIVKGAVSDPCNGIICDSGMSCINGICIEDVVEEDCFKFKAMAANITSGEDQSYDPGHGTRIFQGLKPDIVMIQEFNYDNNSNSEIRSFVDEAFGSEFSYHRGKYYHDIPNGIISRWPIIDYGQWDDPNINNRDLDWAVVDLPGDRDLFVISVHLHTSPAANQVTAAGVIAEKIRSIKIAQPGRYYFIAGGDFNGRSAVTNSSGFGKYGDFATYQSYPVGEDNDKDTNASRRSQYDFVLSGSELVNYHEAATFIGTDGSTKSYYKGLVFDSRDFSQSELDRYFAPVRHSDSDAFNMQHMGVIRQYNSCD